MTGPYYYDQMINIIGVNLLDLSFGITVDIGSSWYGPIRQSCIIVIIITMSYMTSYLATIIIVHHMAKYGNNNYDIDNLFSVIY